MPKTTKRPPSGSKKGMNLIKGLVNTLKKQDFDYQLTKTAEHFGVSKQTVLKEILGR